MKKSQLKQIIREETKKVLKEYSDSDISMSFNVVLGDLEDALKSVRNPEKWIEKLNSRSARAAIELIDRVTTLLGRVR